MADIELVIKIPEEIRLVLINNIQLSLDQQSICDSYIKRAIINGTPLPKGHGRLIDADAELEGLRKTKVVDEKDKQSVRFAIIEYENALTIVEADKAESEE